MVLNYFFCKTVKRIELNLLGQKSQHFDEVVRLVAIFGDCSIIIGSLLFGFWLRFKSGFIPKAIIGFRDSGFGDVNLFAYRDLIIVGFIVAFIAFSKVGLYKSGFSLLLSNPLPKVANGCLLWLAVYLGGTMVFKIDPQISRLYVICVAVILFLAMVAWRGSFVCFLRSNSKKLGLRLRVLLVGWSKDAARILEANKRDGACLYEIVGAIKISGVSFSDSIAADVSFVGELSDIKPLLRDLSIDTVILVQPEISVDKILELSKQCEMQMIQFKVIPSYFQVLISGLKIENIFNTPVLGVGVLPLERLSNRFLKRTVDLIGSVVGLVLSIPIIIIFGLIIYYQSPGPIFYRQIRTGRRGKSFSIIKLRSMKLDAEKGGAQWAKANDDRRLPVGAFLRSWNLDEVPQFWNVFVGEMSLVGPRPERPELIEKFMVSIPHYNNRLISKPGMTGWAQINGLRGDTDLVERVRCDLYYLENWSLISDFQIMIQTFTNRKNAY